VIALTAERLAPIVAAALAEDLGSGGDVTTEAVIRSERRAVGHLVARRPLVLAGLPVARAVFLALDPTLTFEIRRAEGTTVEGGERIASVRGAARPILTGERTALNFLLRMCGIASAARAAVKEIAGTAARILDTRKTAPGLRLLDKYAVAAGGAENHRLGLYDGVMIKDTHLEAGASIAQAVADALARGQPRASITVEADDLRQVDEAIAAGAGRVLLDNLSLDELREAVRRARGRIVLEASGGLRPGGLRAVAETGVDFLSVGWITHSAPAADLALELERCD
jgi:nicotinate-nucleotide pyrophosphorylase (carboxylating)